VATGGRGKGLGRNGPWSSSVEKKGHSTDVKKIKKGGGLGGRVGKGQERTVTWEPRKKLPANGSNEWSVGEKGNGQTMGGGGKKTRRPAPEKAKEKPKVFQKKNRIERCTSIACEKEKNHEKLVPRAAREKKKRCHHGGTTCWGNYSKVSGRVAAIKEEKTPRGASKKPGERSMWGEQKVGLKKPTSVPDRGGVQHAGKPDGD